MQNGADGPVQFATPRVTSLAARAKCTVSICGDLSNFYASTPVSNPVVNYPFLS